MTERDGGRRDLAAMLSQVMRALGAVELPVLDAHGVSMWGYVVLTALRESPVRTQAALAEAIGADKTRIIGTLDELQEAGLIVRERDPADRRARLLSITEEGREVHSSTQADIQEKENRLLAMLPPDDRRGFLNAIEAMSALPREDIVAMAEPPGGGARR
ncbi:MarR family winged helix-turn-helix transcriptional regulator [Phytoactinopolyspora endophytica]|uniref:MarR family winged helix-turn-helix transcriptional regulator n=1 Tax=Phytoactinopolyspora endophytica TaxID=1642495 RepID=UPI00101CFC9D|nr:MarR family transcriptional regulator [Phytoactinopolyspora endophytica]